MDQRLDFRVARMHLAELAKKVVVESSVVGLCFAAIYSAAVRAHIMKWASGQAIETKRLVDFQN